MSLGVANKIVTTPYLYQYRGKKTSSGLAYTPRHNICELMASRLVPLLGYRFDPTRHPSIIIPL